MLWFRSNNSLASGRLDCPPALYSLAFGSVALAEWRTVMD
jgi:hypothetical protein